MGGLRAARWLCAIGIACALAGCGRSRPARFYILTPLAQATAEATDASRATVGIGPVEFPKYLDRPQLVQQQDGHRLKLAESDRWAEPLDAGFTRVLCANLSLLLSGEQIEAVPWRPSSPVAMRVIVDVIQFESTDRSAATLHARWSLVSAGGGVVEPWRRSVHTAAAKPGDYAGAAAALSEVTLRFAEDVADSIRKAGAIRSDRPANAP